MRLGDGRLRGTSGKGDLRGARYRSRVAFGESTLFASKPLRHPSKINASPNDEGQNRKADDIRVM